VAEDLKNQPNYSCVAYKAMERAWAIMRDTCAGTLHLRDQGSRYLPIEPAEDSRDFEIRGGRAIFFNAVERMLHGHVGLVFRKEPTLGDDAPEAIRGKEAADTAPAVESHWENIDLAGTHGSVFCKEVFTDAMRDGGYFPASRQASKWPGVRHQTCLKRLPDCSSSAPPQIGQVSPATNTEARVSSFSPNWFRLSFMSVAD
jgi:hypothetical protein